MCDNLMSDLGYTCFPMGESVSRLLSPLTFPDGEMAGAYIHDLGGNRYRVSDEADTLAYLRTHNINLRPNRIAIVENIATCNGVELSENGELHASATKDTLSWVISNLINASLNVSHYQNDWAAQVKNRTFRDFVDDFLRGTFDNVERKVRVRGLSGIQLEIPFVIPGSKPVYVHTVGGKSGNLNLHKVFEVAGMMRDLRETDAKLAVILDDQPSPDLGKAEAVLADTASVYPYSLRHKWLNSLAA
jgi:hypothetical protein